MGFLLRVGLVLAGVWYGGQYLLNGHPGALEGKLNAQVERKLARDLL